jgi:uncharacterized protein
MALTPFHIAVQVRDLDEARHFYKDVLGCGEGRSDTHWVDFDFFGHQFVCYLNAALSHGGRIGALFGAADGHGVPVPHCGVVLEMPAWRALADRLRGHRVRFEIEPTIRFTGQPGEQATMFLFDPSGNALEFKAFDDIGAQLFAT